MAKLITGVLLLVALAAAATTAVVTGAAVPGLQARRSRFLLPSSALYNPSYDCFKKSAAVCLAPESPGPTCCGGRCVDTDVSANHCGGCNKVCREGRTCCGGHCVDLLSNKDSCGKCGSQCYKKCTNGFCDYAL
ncbi:hypothetical protein ACP70R_031779 [Stipagrostis hirtigluma subsp. patula]